MVRERSSMLGGRSPNAAPFCSIHLAASRAASLSPSSVALFRSFHPVPVLRDGLVSSLRLRPGV
eukprot:11172285-Lingulodinium_polyedra.AAC.1